MGYLYATGDLSLESAAGVKDKRGGAWLKMWVDSDHAGEPLRRSTTGWAPLLEGHNGTRALLGLASRK